jgi:glutamyl/glutaminyl-tRNA synthetase
MKAVLMPTRLALTGRAHGPELARLVASLGRVEAIARLERVARA